MTPRFYFITIRMAMIHNSHVKSCWERCGERGKLVHCWWDCKPAQLLWNSIWRFHRKLEIVLPNDPALPLSGIYPKDFPPHH